MNPLSITILINSSHFANFCESTTTALHRLPSYPFLATFDYALAISAVPSLLITMLVAKTAKPGAAPIIALAHDTTRFTLARTCVGSMVILTAEMPKLTFADGLLLVGVPAIIAVPLTVLGIVFWSFGWWQKHPAWKGWQAFIKGLRSRIGEDIFPLYWGLSFAFVVLFCYFWVPASNPSFNTSRVYLAVLYLLFGILICWIAICCYRWGCADGAYVPPDPVDYTFLLVYTASIFALLLVTIAILVGFSRSLSVELLPAAQHASEILLDIPPEEVPITGPIIAPPTPPVVTSPAPTAPPGVTSPTLDTPPAVAQGPHWLKYVALALVWCVAVVLAVKCSNYKNPTPYGEYTYPDPSQPLSFVDVLATTTQHHFNARPELLPAIRPAARPAESDTDLPSKVGESCLGGDYTFINSFTEQGPVLIFLVLISLSIYTIILTGGLRNFKRAFASAVRSAPLFSR